MSISFATLQRCELLGLLDKLCFAGNEQLFSVAAHGKGWKLTAILPRLCLPYLVRRCCGMTWQGVWQAGI